jgi:lysophospholipase L1-like esterase
VSTTAAAPPAAGPTAPASGRGPRIVRAVTSGIALLSFAAAFGADVVLEGEPGFGAAQWLALGMGVVAGAVSLLPVRFGKRFLLLVGTLTVTIGLAEGAMRLLLDEWLSSLFEFHPRRIYTLKPGARTRYMHAPVNGGQSVLTEINAEGFRGPAPSADSTCRVAVYGDSFVLAAFTELRETFVARLGHQLREQVPGTETVNAGVIGYGPDQTALKLEDEIQRLQPDLVVLALCPNDFGDLLRNKLFKLDDAGALRENTPHLTDSLKRSLRGASSDPYFLKAIAKFRRRFEDHPPPSVEGDLERCRDEYRSYVVEGNDRVEDTFEDHDDADLRVDPEGEAARYKKRLMTGVLRRFRDAAAKHGVPVVVVLIPAALDACETFDGRRVDAAKYPLYRRSAITDAMAEAAAAANLPAVNLFPVFRAKDPNKLYLHGTDDHWNAAGQDVAAGHVAAYLLSKGLVSARSGR